MRRTAMTILALAGSLSLVGCNTITGKPVRTEMIVANDTGHTITVSFDQSADNTGSTPIAVDQAVTPGSSIRYSGKQGDEVVVRAGDEPPLRLVFARRCQVVKVSEDAGEVRFDIRRGYTDTSR